jgi:aminoglycoside phosphotransferase (APT) family kinase protein
MSQDTPRVDAARQVRQGEALDMDALSACLRDHLPQLTGDLVVEQFPSGHSNLTYLLRVGQDELVLRRPPFGAKIKSAHDMGREHRILSGLHKVYPKVPRPLLYVEDEAVLGAPFYVMERLRGVIPRGMKPIPGLDPQGMRLTCQALVDELVAIHGVDLEAAGLQDLGRPQGYVRRQVQGWSRRYRDAQTEEIPQMEALATWLDQNQPSEVAATLIHNDYKYDNVVFDPQDMSRIIGVLDWEMATVGDPLMDLGTTLGYWIEPGDLEHLGALPFGPTALPGNLNRREVVLRYAETSGRDIDDALFYYVYALFKIATILQQIYARYHKGLTQDPRFAMFIYGVKLLAQTATHAVDKGRIDRVWEG